MEEPSVFEKICILSIESHGGDAAYEVMEHYLRLLGCDERELQMFRASWRQAEDDCGSSSYPHTFSKQLLRRLRENLVKDTSAEVPLTSVFGVGMESLVQHRVEMVVERLKGLVSSATLARAVTLQRQRFRAMKFTANADVPSMLPLSVENGCTWRCGDYRSKSGEEAIPAVSCSVPRTWLVTIERMWMTFASLVEMWCLCDHFVPPPLPCPVNCYRNGTSGDVTISLCRRTAMPLINILTAQLVIELHKSEFVLECWIAQMFAVLASATHAAKFCLSEFDIDNVSISEGLLLIGQLSFVEYIDIPPIRKLNSSMLQLFSNVFGLSRTLSVSALHSKRVKIPLMQGCGLKILADPKLKEVASSRESFTILESSGSDVDTIRISKESAKIETKLLSSKPFRCVRLIGRVPYDEVEIEIEIFPRPSLVTSVLVAETLATLEAIEKATMPEESLLCTVALSVPPVIRPDEKIVRQEWEEIFRKCAY